MRVAVIHSFYSAAQPSGENVVVIEQTEQLRAAGHDVRLVALRTDDLKTQRTYQMQAAVACSVGWGRGPTADLDTFAPDVVHLHNTFPNFGTAWLRRWGERTVVTMHNYRTMCAAGTFYRDGHQCHDCLTTRVIPAVRHGCYRNSSLQTVPIAIGTGPGGGLSRIGRRAAHLVALNDGMAQQLVRAFGPKVSVIPNFVARSSRADPVAGQWAFIGRHSAEKGLRELLVGWSENRQLHIFGDGPDRAVLMAEFPESHGRRWRGLVPRDQLLAELRTYEGLILPSLWPEGLPTVVLEALARGVPIAMSNIVAATPELEFAQVAAPFDPRSPESICRAVGAVAQGGPAMRARSASLYESLYSPEAWTAQIVATYESVVVNR